MHANQSPPVPISLPFVRLAPDFMGNAPFSPFQPPREEEAQVFREWGMKPRVVDVDLVNIALSAIFSRKQREREKGREGEDRRKKNGYSVIHVGRGVRIATREGKKRGETINRLVCEEDWYVMILA